MENLHDKVIFVHISANRFSFDKIKAILFYNERHFLDWTRIFLKKKWKLYNIHGFDL